MNMLILLLLLVPMSSSLDTPPQLECLENAMRLHFIPDNITLEGTVEGGNPPETFHGHVYIKGFFFSSHCHLDYSRRAIAQPFIFQIPYRSDCQVRRERTQAGILNDTDVTAPTDTGVLYQITIIVQHHRLFVTNADKAYSISCFYKDARNDLERRLEVGDLTPSGVEGIREAPPCRYDVVRADVPESDESVRYANIGELLIHRWTCDTTEMGMLVHSCLVRDGIGHQFAILDERGWAKTLYFYWFILR